MKISNTKTNNKGFTIIELVVVIAGLAALGSFAIPNVLNTIKLNRVEEAKAIMNGYASDCLGMFRISTALRELTGTPSKANTALVQVSLLLSQLTFSPLLPAASQLL